MEDFDSFEEWDDDFAPCILEGHDVSYCQDHNACQDQWAKHDAGEHENCHPAVCDAAA